MNKKINLCGAIFPILLSAALITPKCGSTDFIARLGLVYEPKGQKIGAFTQ